MKKLDNVINISNEKKEGQQLKKHTDLPAVDQTITCDCCSSELSTSPSQQSIATRKVGEENGIVDERDDEEQQHVHSENQKSQLLSDKLLIVIGLALTIPIVILELAFPHDSFATRLVILAFATAIQVLLGRPFYYRFFHAVRYKKKFTTDTLVVLSTSIAYLYSLFTMILTGSHVQFFEASSSVLTIFTIGEYLEIRVLKTTNESLRNLLALKPKTALVIRNGREQLIDSDNILVGDIVITKPGEKIATDGIVVHGQSSVDESMITGESMPIEKKLDNKVMGGTINKNGYLEFKAINVGSNTVLANIIEMVRKAKMSKAPVQRIADRAVQYFIPIVLAIAMSASLYWLVVAHEPISFAVTVFATVLVVSCPCALGIATPMVIALAIDKAAREGVLMKGGEYVEKLSSIDTVVFDKTGTLTKGKLEVTDIISYNNGYGEFELLQIASSLEIKSEHPIGQAIVKKAYEKSIPKLDVTEFYSISGHGVLALYQQKRIFVGNPRKITEEKRNDDHHEDQVQYDHNIYSIGRGSAIYQHFQNSIINDLESEGKTVVAILVEGELAGVVAVADTLREDAIHTIDEIKKLKKEPILMSGDNERTANAIAKKLGVKKVIAQVSPEIKAQEIQRLQSQGKKVIMIGDGINDAPALTQADVGIAIGSGTDVAMSAGHIILMKSDLKHVLYVLKLGQYSLRKIKQNLAMSFTYNVLTISIAAGLLYGITNSLILTPSLAALGWVISDSAVFGNSLFVRKFRK